MTALPKTLLQSSGRKEMWRNAKGVLKKLETVLPIKEVYLRGSFATNKKRPADVDFVILIKTKSRKNMKWSVDFVVCPDNEYGDAVVKDASRWMKQKYGVKKSAFIRLK